MRLASLAATSCLLAAACGEVPAPPTPAESCSGSWTAPVAADPAGPPPAVLHDLAGPPTEFAVGIPGKPDPVLLPGGSSSPPQPRGAFLIQQSLVSTTATVRAYSASGCRVVARGSEDSVSPSGTRLLLLGTQHRPLVDLQGHQLADLPHGNYTWTADSHLVGGDGRTVRSFDANGHATQERPDSGTPVGPVGPAQVALVEGNGMRLFDAITGATTDLDQRYDLAAGSPDGHWLLLVAGAHAKLRAAGSHDLTVATPGPLASILWSPDSAWVALNGQFGAVLLHAADAKTIDLGTMAVSAWVR